MRDYPVQIEDKRMQNQKEQKLAVAFPGIGYHCDKPLLYHAKKIASAQGYEVREVPYQGFPAKVKGDPDKMRQSFLIAMEQAEDILRDAVEEALYFGSTEVDTEHILLALVRDLEWDRYGQILFLSKSVGTCVAAAFAARHGLKTANVYFTPVGATFDFHPQEGIVFHGTADPWASDAEIEEGCRACGLPLINIPDTNHSLESGNPMRDLQILQEVMGRVDEYLMESGE